MRILAAVTALFFSSAAHGATVLDSYNGALKGSITVEPITSNDFGQSVSLLDGTFELSATDVVVTTNSGAVTFGRRLAVSKIQFDEFGIGTDYTTSPLGAFWDFDIPYMRGIFAAAYGSGWASSYPALPLSRCSHIGSPSIYGIGNFYQVPYDPSSYSSGISVNVPGQGEHLVRQRLTGSGVYPTDGHTYVATTKEHGKLSCLANLKYGQGEGFRMVTPDGRTYLFDWLVTRQTSNVNDTTCQASQGNFYRSPGSAGMSFNVCATGVAVPRSEAFLFATEVTDRFGNKTEYVFDPVNPKRLLSIRHNSEILMSFQYVGHRLQKVTSFGREWLYTYSGSVATLASVTRPDSSKWEYATSGLLNINHFNPKSLWAGCVVTVGTMTTSVAPSPGDTAWISVKAPSGATAQFDLRRVVHGTKSGESTCSFTSNGFGLIGPIVGTPSAYQTASLYRMTVTGPGLATYQADYNYFPGLSAPYIASTTVSETGGASRTYVFDTNALKLYGSLIEQRTYDGSEQLSRTVYTYISNATGQNFPDKVGIPISSSGVASNADNLNRPLIDRTIYQDGRTFKWEVPAACDGKYCFDALTRPTKVNRSSTTP